MELTTNENPLLKKKAITYGIILGVVSVVLAIASMYITINGTTLMSSAIQAGAVNYIPFLILVTVFSKSLRTANGGYWSFSVALKNIFIMLAVTALIGTLATMIMNWTMPQLQEQVLDKTRNMTIEYYESINASDEAIDTIVAELDKQRDALGSLSIGQNILGLFIYFLVYFVLALIFAAIFKKEKPMFKEQVATDSAHPWQNNPEA
ncbi:DUF4199 domain-containing protein [Sphingobacterium sp. CZ-2]|uniref:DUF4199 domain-containing protein n=1 Tax=Sphingobacterium sp. CZ-2 TaxID=2557994 RepID=UPI00106FEB24|nr:DUF4199 domain-containing protein [Sphingobacterium sp. CZ-2]QBR13002.1 DUF4199 domain-containing protein [Sphingobacterium sp. CZ-2]